MSLIKTIYGKISDTVSRAIRIDSSTHSVQVLGYEHHEIHAGSHYFVAGFTTLDDLDTLDFAMSTPTGSVEMHMRFTFSAVKEAQFYIYENLNSDWDGTPVTPINNNRNSGNSSGATLQSDPTVNAPGTILFSQSLGLVGNALSERGGAFENQEEMVLKTNSTPYLFRFVSGDDGNIVSYKGYWYEHTPKD